MKNLFLSTIILLLLNSCYLKEAEQRKKENEKLKKELALKDSSMNYFVSILNEIQDNLLLIKEKENIVNISTKNQTEINSDLKENILNDIQTINGLMQENKNKIEKLNKLLKKYKLNSEKYEKLINNLRKIIEEKDNEINKLKKELVSLNFTVESLNLALEKLSDANNEQAKQLKAQDKYLNRAYYAFGTLNELKEKKIIDREGGILGIGKSSKLANDFNREYFTEIDIREIKAIPLFVKKAKIITNHPSDSYKFVVRNKQIDSLIITNPAKFWEASKYLVIEVD